MLSFVHRHWFLALLVIGVGSAVAFPQLFQRLTVWLEPRMVIGFALVLTAWTMPSQSLATELRAPWASLWAVVLSYGFVPGLAWLLGRGLSSELAIGLLLIASVPCTLASAVIWTRLAGGNEATALIAVLGTTMTSWLFTTAWLALAVNTDVEVPAGPLMLDLLVCLVLPVLLGQGMRSLNTLALIADHHRSSLSALAQICVLAIVVRASTAVGTHLHTGERTLALWFWIECIGISLALHLASLYVGVFSARAWRFDTGRQIAIALSCSQKTLPISLFLFERYFKEDFPLAVFPLLFYHVGQLLMDTVIAKHWQRTLHQNENILGDSVTAG